MEEFMSNHVYSLIHWPFFAFAIVAMMINQVIKSSVFTKKRAITKSKMQWFFWWSYKTLPLHPVGLGALVGLVWLNPENDVWPIVASVFYFALGGTLSVWLYQIIKGLAKKRGLDLGELSCEDEENTKTLSVDKS